MERSRGKRFPLPLFALLLGLGLLLALLLVSFRLCRFTGSSMAPTIEDGDLVLFQTWGYTPRQGDIVLLEKPGFPPPPQEPTPIIKRVIAVGGQHIRVDYEANAVFVDGVALEEPYLGTPMTDRRIPDMTLLEVTVPQGSVYVLGDNRGHSVDSRHQALGCVPADCILGRAIFLS